MLSVFGAAMAVAIIDGELGDEFWIIAKKPSCVELEQVNETELILHGLCRPSQALRSDNAAETANYSRELRLVMNDETRRPSDSTADFVF